MFGMPFQKNSKT